MIMTQTARRGVQVPSLRNISHLNDNAAEIELAKDSDLLDLVPQDRVADLRSPRQTELMASLVHQIAELDGEAGSQAREYTDGMTERGLWTPGFEGNASAWISRMIAKIKELKTSTPVQPTQAPKVADGRYAVEHGGALKFFHIRNGKADSRWAGFVFVDVRASDDLYPLKNRATKAEILALIAADPETAMNRYGQELGECGDCGRTLTDKTSRSIGRGPICRSK
jgi:hypothetical protein